MKSARTLGLLLCALTPGAAAEKPVSIRLVAADTGAPVVAAEVRVYAPRRSNSLLEMQRRPIAEATSGADGGVALALPALSGLVLVVDAAGHLPALRQLSEVANGPVKVTLERGAALSRRVSWPPEGPKPQGRVCARFELPHEALPSPPRFERCGSLGEQGSFELTGLPAQAPIELEIRSRGYLPLVERLPLPAGKRLRLSPGLLITGTVVDPVGRSLAGVSLVTSEGERLESATDGSFALRAARLPMGLTAQAPGRMRLELTVRDSLRPLSLRLEPGATVEGQLVAVGGEVPERASIRIDREYAPGSWRPIEGEALKELFEGGFLLSLPGAGRYRTQIRVAGSQPLDVPTFEAEAAAAVNLGVLELAPGGGLTGRVTDASSGRVLPGTLVRLLPQGMAGLRRLTWSSLAETLTDEDGAYRFSAQSGGAYELRFERHGYAPGVLEVEVDERQLRNLDDQHLSAGARVAVQVMDLAARPRAGVAVKVVTPNGASLLPLAEAVSRADGSLEPMTLAPGAYRVEARTDRPLLAQTFTVPEGEADQEWTLELAGVSVVGWVHRGQRPAAGGTLRLAPANDPGARVGKFVLHSPNGGSRQVFGPLPVELVADVNSEGVFELEDVPAGLTTVTYLSPDGETSQRLVEIPALAEAQVSVDLAGSTLAGRVYQAEGEVLPGVSVELRDAAGNLVAAKLSDESGAFVFDGLEDSALVLEARKQGFRTRVLAGLRAGGGDNLAIELESAEAGSLVARLSGPSGSPLSHVYVGLFTPSGARLTSLPLDALGERSWEELAAGTYYLTWSDPALGVGASRFFSVAAGERAEQNLRLETPARVSLLCRDPACVGRPLRVLSILDAQGIDLAAFVPGVSPGLSLSAAGGLDLGKLAPGNYRLLVAVAGRSWDQPFVARPDAVVEVVLGVAPDSELVAALPPP